MVIEDAVVIHAPLEPVWQTFMDLTCWKDWNTVARDVSADTQEITQGKTVSFCLRPFAFPLTIEPTVDEVVPNRRVVWSGKKYGISASHEFIFQQTREGVLVTSRETFRGLLLVLAPFLFPKRRLRTLTLAMLRDLKNAAEKTSAGQAGT